MVQHMQHIVITFILRIRHCSSHNQIIKTSEKYCSENFIKKKNQAYDMIHNITKDPHIFESTSLTQRKCELLGWERVRQSFYSQPTM